MLESPVRVDGLFPEPQEVNEQQLSQNDSANYNQNNSLENTINEYEVTSPIKDATPNNANLTDPQIVPFEEQVLSFIKFIDLWLLATIIWVIGGVCILVSALKESIAFGLLIKKSSQPLTDTVILDMVMKHAKANQINRNIKVSICSSIQMPMTVGIFRPHILFPLNLVDSLSKEHIDVILLHEVCHIKRNDIIKNLACVLVKALHWFNPFVWIAIKAIRNDIEFACDQRVLKLIKFGQEIKYCESLLNAARFMKQKMIPPFVASLCDNKTNLKERIMKIIRPKKKSKTVGLISLVLASVMLIACFTTACQPTPEDSIIQGKEGALDGITEKSDSNTGEVYTAPESWNETLELGEGRLQIDVDAPIEIPDVYAYPIVQSTPGKFSIEKLNQMISYFVGDNTVYEDTSYGDMPVSIYDGLETKSEIQAAILELQLALSDPDSNVNGIKDSDPEAYQQAVESINAQIEMLQERLQTAPETIEQTPLILSDSVATEGARGTVDLGKVSPAKIEINSTDREDGRNNRFVFENMGSMIGVGMVESIETGLRNPPKLSVEDALQLSEKAVNDLAGNEMQLSCVAVAAYDDKLSPVRTESYLDSEQYYVFYFTRSVGSVPYTYQSNLGIGSDKENGNYLPTYPYEYIQVGVDDTGIIEFIWRSPAEIGEVLTNNVSLLSFNEIKDIFKQQIYVQQVWNESTEDAVARKIYIEKITLGMMRVINPGVSIKR
jgi:beta-lactamase regulating signal transducer with metallopeptidase domain